MTSDSHIIALRQCHMIPRETHDNRGIKKTRRFGDLHCDEVLCGERLCDEAQRRSRRNPFTKGRRKLHFWPWRNKREKASPTGLSLEGKRERERTKITAASDLGLATKPTSKLCLHPF